MNTEAEFSQPKPIKRRKTGGRKVVTTSFPLPPELIEKLRTDAARLQISVAKWLREILYDWYKKSKVYTSVDLQVIKQPETKPRRVSRQPETKKVRVIEQTEAKSRTHKRRQA